jgi:signal transduction histidine kinase
MAVPLRMPLVGARSRAARGVSPAPTRPLPWVSSLLYGAVLLAGVFYDLVGNDGPHVGRMIGFVAALAALMALDVAERRRYLVRTPTRPAVVLLVVRVLLLLVVAALDSAGLSRPLFVLIPFTAYFAFGRVTSLALAATELGALLAGLALTVPGWYSDLEHVSDVLMFTIGLVLALSMAAVAAGEQQARGRLELVHRELETSHARLTAYADQVAELSAATERNRLARDIHDSLGHHLTAIAVQIEKASAFRTRDPAAADLALRDAQSSARRALDDVRRSVHALRDEAPAVSLSDALADLVAQVRDEFLTVTLAISGEQHGYGDAPLTALYRAAQEALTNARRHAAASRVDVAVEFTEFAAHLMVADDGRGLPESPGGPTADGRSGFGLLGMRERVHLVGGHVDITSRADFGTRVNVTVPRAPTAATR